jgi:hypothetical protein
MRGLGLLLAGLVLAVPARGTTSYNSLASMQAANPTLTFQNLSFGDFGTSATSYLFEVGDLDFIFTANQNLGLTLASTPGGWPAGTTLRSNVNSVIITVTLPAEVIGFGANFGYGTATATDVTVAGNNDGAFSVTRTTGSVGPNPQYLGLVGTGSFTTLTITSSAFNARFGLNNFVYALAPDEGGGGDVPEPGTMALIGTGLMMIPLLQRLRRRR